MRQSLLDQLYYSIDLGTRKAEAPPKPPMTPAQRTPEVEDYIGNQQAPKDISGMKFTHSLIKHLDKLYGKMLAGEVKELTSESDYNSKQKIIEGQTDSLVLNEKESFYNPGNSAVTESM